MKTFHLYVFILCGVVFSFVSKAQIAPLCPPCNPTCSGGYLHWPDVWCFEDTIQLWATWNSNINPAFFQWYALDTTGAYGVIIGSNGYDTVSVSGLATYCLEIIDSSGCLICAGGIWPGNMPYHPTIEYEVTPTYCDVDIGSIHITVTGGFSTDTYTYLWSNGETSQDLDNLPSGDYTITVTRTNVNGWECPSVFSFTVINHSPELSAELMMDSSCVDGDGSINLTVFPPGFNYEYIWSNGATTQDLHDVASGSYWVTVTGPSQCSATELFVITDDSNPIDGLSTIVTPAFCNLPTGIADLSIIGGTSPFIFSWTNGSNLEDPDNFLPGEYEVTVTGYGDCSATTSIIVTNVDSLLTLSSVVTSNTSCSPFDGEVNLTLTPPGMYSYDWLTGQSTQDLTDIAAGYYEVTITAGTCQLFGNYVVEDHSLIPNLTFVTISSSCGQPNGSINLSVNGGQPTYDYVWSNENLSQDLSGILAGIYSVTVTGNNGCSATASDTVMNGGNTFTISSLITANTSCIDSNGSVSLSLTPVDSYAFLWSNGATSEDIINLSEGTYTVMVSQDSTCFATESFVVTDSIPAPDTLLFFSSSCHPADTGIFVLHLTDHNGCDSVHITQVDLLISDVNTIEQNTCDPSQAGTFTQSLVNLHGCDSIVITNVSLLDTDTTTFSETTCDTFLAGTVIQVLSNQEGCDSLVITTTTLLPSNSTSLFSKTCDASQAGLFIQHLTNQYGCDSTIVETVEWIPDDETFLFSNSCDSADVGVFTVNLVNQFGCDSIVTLTISYSAGDTMILNFKTCDPSQVGSIENSYTNQNGCDSLVIEQTSLYPLPDLQLLVTSDFNGYDISCFGEADGSALANVTGVSPYSYIWSTGSTDQNITGLSSGSYTVTITDANGCGTDGEITLSDPGPFMISFIVSNPDCFDQHNGSISVEQTGGVMPIRYSIDEINYQSSPSFTGLSGGTYNITALDANDCEKKEIIWINVPLLVNVDLGDDQTILPGDTTVIHAIVNIPFDSLASITWSGLTNPNCPTCLTQPVVPIVTTTYSVSVTSVDGCKDEDALTLFLEKNTDIYIPNIFSPNGDNINDKLIISAGSDVEEISSLIIFDRWGNMVFSRDHFQANDPNVAWDGRLKGRELNSAVFAYRLIAKFKNGSQFIREGDVTLLR